MCSVLPSARKLKTALRTREHAPRRSPPATNKRVDMLLPHVVPGSEDEFDKMFLEHGAVLLRGFNFTTAEEFATFYANNPGFKCLHDYFPAEHGRGRGLRLVPLWIHSMADE